MHPTFINFHERRYQWAFDAKKEFLNRFQKLDVQMVDAQNELTISVYGPTQVGKTTLILTLMGIKEDYLANVSDFLRGTRQIGQSATVTVTKYIRSSDEYYHVKFPNRELVSNINEHELEQAMFTLRQQIEGGEENSVEPVVIAIPKHLFEERDVSIQIIDLPGVESAEEKEVEHVQRCIKHWLPLTELCLLVMDAADLKGLAQFTSRDIRSWYEHPKYYRVVLTRAGTLDSIIKGIQHNKLCNFKDLINYYSNLLENELPIETNLEDIVYPVEIGHSFIRLRNKTEPVYQQMKVIVKDIVKKLIQDITSLDYNELSFSRLTGLYHDAETLSKEELDESFLRIHAAQERVSHLELLKKQHSNVGNTVLKLKIEQLNKVKATIEGELTRIQILNVEDLVKEKIPVDYTNKYASQINDASARFQLAMEEEIRKKIKGLTEQMLALDVIPKQFELGDIPPIYSINRKIDKIWFDGQYSKEMYLVHATCKHWLVQVHVRYKRTLSERLLQITEALQEVKNEVERIRAEHELEMRKIDRNLKQAMVHLKQVNKEHASLEKTWQADCLHARQLQQYFIKHWLLYKEELEEKCYSEEPAEKWGAFQYLQILLKDGKTIIQSLDPVEE